MKPKKQPREVVGDDTRVSLSSITHNLPSQAPMNYDLPAHKSGRKPRVFSYQRFSSGSQAAGSSLERQDVKFQQFFVTCCEPKGYVFDSKFVDDGKSGRGKHLEGALGAFLKGGESGKVHSGDVLAVECFNRLSRMSPTASVELLLKIVRTHKATLVFLDNPNLGVINEDALNENDTLLFMLQMDMKRGYMEVEERSERVEVGLKHVQDQVLSGERAYSSNGPRWLKAIKEVVIINGKEKLIPISWEVIPERAKIIKQIFEWRADGKTITDIQDALIEKGIKSFEGKEVWPRATMTKYFQTKHVLGIAKFTNFEEEQKIYPAIIEEDLYWKVKAVTKSHRNSGYARSASKNRKIKRSNLFTGILNCGYGQGKMELGALVEKPNGTYYQYLRPCSHNDSKNKKKHIPNLWDYDKFEKQFLDYALNLDWKSISEKTDIGKSISTASRIEQIEAKIETRIEAKGNLLKAIEQGADYIELSPRMEELKSEIEELVTDLSEERNELDINDNLGAFEIKNGKWIHLMESIDLKDESIRKQISNEIKSKISSIELFANGWIWNQKTFQLALRYLPPAFAAMYQDVEGHLPRYRDSGFQQATAKKNYRDMAFFLVHWRNGFSQFWMPHFEKVKGFIRPFGYLLDPTNSMRADSISMEGDDKREPFELNPRALGFEIEAKFAKGIEDRHSKLKRADQRNWKSFLALQRAEQLNSAKKIRAMKNPKNRFETYQEMLGSGVELSQKESREYYKLRQKFLK